MSRRAFLRARAYMEANLGERVLLADVAAAAHLSRSHFARAFRITTGQSVMAYLRRLRIERAKFLLVEREVSIAELSAQLGFAHHSHFTRLFRREIGMAPRTYAHHFGLPAGASNAEARGYRWLQAPKRPHESSNRDSFVQAPTVAAAPGLGTLSTADAVVNDPTPRITEGECHASEAPPRQAQ